MGTLPWGRIVPNKIGVEVEVEVKVRVGVSEQNGYSALRPILNP
jgi:hypothetical protein